MTLYPILLIILIVLLILSAILIATSSFLLSYGDRKLIKKGGAEIEYSNVTSSWGSFRLNIKQNKVIENIDVRSYRDTSLYKYIIEVYSKVVAPEISISGGNKNAIKFRRIAAYRRKRGGAGKEGDPTTAADDPTAAAALIADNPTTAISADDTGLVVPSTNIIGDVLSASEVAAVSSPKSEGSAPKSEDVVTTPEYVPVLSAASEGIASETVVPTPEGESAQVALQQYQIDDEIFKNILKRILSFEFEYESYILQLYIILVSLLKTIFIYLNDKLNIENFLYILNYATDLLYPDNLNRTKLKLENTGEINDHLANFMLTIINNLYNTKEFNPNRLDSTNRGDLLQHLNLIVDYISNIEEASLMPTPTGTGMISGNNSVATSDDYDYNNSIDPNLFGQSPTNTSINDEWETNSNLSVLTGDSADFGDKTTFPVLDPHFMWDTNLLGVGNTIQESAPAPVESTVFVAPGIPNQPIESQNLGVGLSTAPAPSSFTFGLEPSSSAFGLGSSSSAFGSTVVAASPSALPSSSSSTAAPPGGLGPPSLPPSAPPGGLGPPSLPPSAPPGGLRPLSLPPSAPPGGLGPLSLPPSTPPAAPLASKKSRIMHEIDKALISIYTYLIENNKLIQLYSRQLKFENKHPIADFCIIIKKKLKDLQVKIHDPNINLAEFYTIIGKKYSSNLVTKSDFKSSRYYSLVITNIAATYREVIKLAANANSLSYTRTPIHAIVPSTYSRANYDADINSYNRLIKAARDNPAIDAAAYNAVVDTEYAKAKAKRDQLNNASSKPKNKYGPATKRYTLSALRG